MALPLRMYKYGHMGRPFLGSGLSGSCILMPYSNKDLFLEKNAPKDEDLLFKFLDLDNKSRMWQTYSKIHKLFLFTGCHL
jgi:hypothetical protein